MKTNEEIGLPEEDEQELMEPRICLKCLHKEMGRYVDSLTWAFTTCSICHGWGEVTTKVKYIPQLKGRL